jgi:hypothetical protein
VTKLCLIVLKLDIHYVSSDGYIASFDLFWIAIVFCAMHRYIESFELNGYALSFVKLMDSLNLSIRTIEHT